MTARRLSPSSLSAILCSSVGLWVSCGALAVAGVEAGAPRIGVLPSLWWLGALLIGGIAAAIVVRPLPRQVAVLWLSALTILPWSPWLPPPLFAAVLVFAGPLRAWIWVAIVVGLAIPGLAKVVRGRRMSVATNPGRTPWLAAALAASVYLLAAWSISPRLPAGDEPHYLIITQSLLLDRDLKIENNHARGDYHQYFALPLKPDFLQRGIDGQIYSIHAPGLPVFVAPVFALLGYPGVLAFLALVSGAATGLAWIAVWRVTSDIAASWFGWATVALSAPFLFQAFTVYPDGLGAALVMVGVSAILASRDLSRRMLTATGAALALLPWLHTRFSLTAGALGVALLVREWHAPDRLRRIVAFAAIPAVSAIAWFWFFAAIYGTPNPAAPYGGYTQSAIGNLPRGLTGLLLDQQFGILPNAPVYICALLGVPTLTRTLPRLAAELAFVVVPYSLATAAYFMWWGGFSSPGRFLVSILLPLSIPAGVWFANRGLAGRLLSCAALLLSVMISVSLAIVGRGALVYDVRDGASKLLLWLAPLVDLTTALPSLFQTGPAGALLRSSVWLLAILLTSAVGLSLAHARWPARGVALGLGLSTALTGMLALSTVWRIGDSQPITALRAGPGVLAALDPDAGQVALRFQPMRRLHLEDVPPLLPIAGTGGGRPTDPLAVVAHPVAATYRIDAVITDEAGSITAGVDRATPLWKWTVPSGFRGPWRQSISLPVRAFQLRVDGDAASRRGVSGLGLHAERVPGASARMTTDEAGHAARYGPALVFFVKGSAFLEPGGAWVAGRASATFAIVPESAPKVHLFLRNFAGDNTVTVDGGGSRQQLSLKPREERSLDLSLEPGRTGIVVRITSASGTKPSDLEPGNLDQRLLGCWIETR